MFRCRLCSFACQYPVKRLYRHKHSCSYADNRYLALLHSPICCRSAHSQYCRRLFYCHHSLLFHTLVHSISSFTTITNSIFHIEESVNRFLCRYWKIFAETAGMQV